MNIAILGNHLLISFVAWIIGIGLGGGLGYGCALVARRILKASRNLKKPFILFPWRTIVISLPLLSPFVPVLIGLGTIAGIVMIGIFVFVLALMFTITIMLNYWFSPPLTPRLFAGARSLAVAAPVMAVSAYWIGGGGLGGLIWQRVQLRFDYSALLEVVLMAFVFDIVMGVIQMIIGEPGYLQPEV